MQKVISSLLAACRSVHYVPKNGKNPMGYSYATEADVVAKVRKNLLDNDLVLVPSVGACSFDPTIGLTEVHIDYRLIHSSGEMLEFRVVGHGLDRNKSGVGDKGVYKAITGATKYALLKLLLLATGDDPETEDADKNDLKDKEAERTDSKDKDALRRTAALMRDFIKECDSVKTLEKYYKDNHGFLLDLKDFDSQLYTEILADFANHKKGLS